MALERMRRYWESEPLRQALYEKISSLGYDLRRVDVSCTDELAKKLTLKDLACVGPSTLAERLTRYPASIDAFAAHQLESALRCVKITLINEEAERTGKLTEEQEVYGMVSDFNTGGESLNGAAHKIIFST